MSADAAIRRLRSDDAASFKAIRLEALKANPELLRSAFEVEDKLDVAWFAGRLEDAHIVGAFRDGELVGTASFAIQQGQPNAHKGRLFTMYVRPSSRNLGVGRLLLSAVLNVAREHVELVQLSVVRENRPALKLYESAGFLEFGVEKKPQSTAINITMKHSWPSTSVVRRIFLKKVQAILKVQVPIWRLRERAV